MIRNWIHATSVKEINRRLRNEEVRQAILAVDAEEHAENERVDVKLEQAVDDVVHANNDKNINDKQKDYDQNYVIMVHFHHKQAVLKLQRNCMITLVFMNQ